MRVVISCDHGGFPLKNELIDTLANNGYEVIDVGTNDTNPVDYPDFVSKACQAILEGKTDKGIVICGSGVGACITANKFRGIYAALCHDHYTAHQAVEHDNANVLCMGARVIGPELAKEITLAFLGAKFSKEERHERRIEKTKRIEKKEMG